MFVHTWIHVSIKQICSFGFLCCNLHKCCTICILLSLQNIMDTMLFHLTSHISYVSTSYHRSITRSSFLTANQYSTAWIYYIIFLYFPTDGHSACFLFFSIVNKTIWNIWAQGQEHPCGSGPEGHCWWQGLSSSSSLSHSWFKLSSFTWTAEPSIPGTALSLVPSGYSPPG